MKNSSFIRGDLKSLLLIALLNLLCFSAFSNPNNRKMDFEKTDVSQTSPVKGIILDEQGNPLLGATVYLKGNPGTGVTTNLDGAFTISANSSDILVISYIGMKTQEILIGDQTEITILLKEDFTELSEVMVVAYGTSKRETFTGSASVVGADKLEDRPVASFTAALAANSTGLVINTSGQPGAAEVVRIRGTGSENAANGPLYIIDGIAINMSDLSKMSTSGSNPMATINPSDIASITVLKDAAAASLYGSRAANGVIIVTTKQGQEGKTKFNLDVQYGVANALYNKPMADKDQYAEKWVEGEMHRLMGMDAIFTGLSQIDYIKDTYASEGTYNYYQNAARNNFNRTYALNGVEYDFWGDGYGEYPNTNWYDHVSQQGGTRKINLSASGGQNGITFFTSGEYYEQIGTIKGSGLSRISGRLNLTSKTNKHVWFGVNMNMSYNNQDGPLLGNLFVNPLRAAANIPPVVPVYYNGEPNLSLAGGILNNYNPVAIREMNIYNKSGTRNISTAWAQLNFTKDLFLKTTFGYDNRPLYEIRWENPVVGTGAALSGRRQDIETTRRRLTSSTILNYTKTIKEKHNLSALAGWESELTHTTELGAVATGYANSLTPILSTGTTPTETIGRTWDDALLSGFSQLQYNYDNKYYTQVSYRADGSSRFGELGRWNQFYSVSGSWRLSQEDFMDFSWLDDAKIRASFGTNGTLPSELYGFLSNFTLGYDYYNLSGALINNIQNNNLSWESSENTNLGAEIKVFDGRIFASAEYYRRLTKNLLINKEISRTSGFTNALVNFGSIENKGFEYTLDADIVRMKNLNWNVTVNLSTLRNMVLELPNDQVGPTNIDRVGYAEGSLYLPEYVGVDPSTGSPLWNYVDDETGEINLTDNYAKASRQIIGTREPQKSGGISSMLKYKNFDLSVLFSFAWDYYTLDYAASRYTQTDGGQSYLNFETVQMDSWTPIDTLAANPIRINGVTNGGQFSTRHAYDGAYFKMKNIRLGYMIPQSISKKLMISSCRLFIQGENIFVLTDMPNFDPEIRVNGYRYIYDFPSPKMYTVGINLTF